MCCGNVMNLVAVCDGCVVSVSPVIPKPKRVVFSLPSRASFLRLSRRSCRARVGLGSYDFRYGVRDHDTSRQQQLASALVGLGRWRSVHRLALLCCYAALRYLDPFILLGWASGRGMEQPPSEGEKTEGGMCVRCDPVLHVGRRRDCCAYATKITVQNFRGLGGAGDRKTKEKWEKGRVNGR